MLAAIVMVELLIIASFARLLRVLNLLKPVCVPLLLVMMVAAVVSEEGIVSIITRPTTVPAVPTRVKFIAFSIIAWPAMVPAIPTRVKFIAFSIIAWPATVPTVPSKVEFIAITFFSHASFTAVAASLETSILLILLMLSCVVKVMMISTPTASVASSEISTFTASKSIASVTTITPAAPANSEVAVNCFAVDLLDHGFLFFLRVIGMLDDNTLSWKWCRLFVMAQGFCLNLNFVVLKLLGNNWLTFNFMLVICVSSHV
jgi:hypothetical protein